MNNEDTLLTLVFIFKDKGANLSEVKAIKPGRRGKSKAKARLLTQLNKMNIASDGNTKFRMVDVRFKDYINRNHVDSHIEVIEKYYKDRYSKKRYDSPKRWFKTWDVENLLEQEKEQFLARIQEYKREQTITNLIGDE